jgi:hypothetical protein
MNVGTYPAEFGTLRKPAVTVRISAEAPLTVRNEFNASILHPNWSVGRPMGARSLDRTASTTL